MKRRIYILIVCLVNTVFFSSCSDWFDVSPKTNVKAEELFETENGYLSALAGIYVSMTDAAAYGGNLSFGMMDQLAQSYDMVPTGASDRATIYTYDVGTDGYNTKARLAESWKQAYNLIANANNLLNWLDKNSENVIRDPETRNMIYGEALAIRAYIHFDLLRGWGPMYHSEPNALSIPYREVADNSKQPLLPANEVLKRILRDLESAQKYLAYEAETSLTGRTGTPRRYRFNYHAVTALMARVYCYMNDPVKAIRCAQNVIDHCGLKLQVSNQEDPVLFEEALCALNMHKMQENLSSRFSEGGKMTSQYFCSTATLNALFEATGSTASDVDMRVKSSAFYRNNSEQQAITRKYIKNDNGAIPLLRLPEMYYILCEMSSLEDAPQYINLVRNRRGYSTAADYQSFSDNEDRNRALDTEYRKEFYAEGQYFYFLKNHEFTYFINCPVSEMGKAQYVFPLPDAEKEYGWTPPVTEEGSGSEDKDNGDKDK